MLNRMPHYPPLLIKFKDKHPRELVLVLALEFLLRRGRLVRGSTTADDELFNPIDGIATRVRGVLVHPARAVAVASFPARFPLDDEMLVAIAAAGRDRVVVPHHALREDGELHVADEGHAAPGYGRGPQRGDVGDPSRDGREVRVRGGEEVEGDLGTEDFAGEGGLQKGGEAVVEDLHGLAELERSFIWGLVVVVVVVVVAGTGDGSEWCPGEEDVAVEAVVGVIDLREEAAWARMSASWCGRCGDGYRGGGDSGCIGTRQA